jgi:hypothetical protein
MRTMKVCMCLRRCLGPCAVRAAAGMSGGKERQRESLEGASAQLA